MTPTLARCLILLAALPAFAAALPDRVTPLARHLLPRTGLEIVSGEVLLPRNFRGRLEPAPGDTALALPFLVPVEAPRPAASEEAEEEEEPTPAPDAPVRYRVLAQRRSGAREARLELRDAKGAPLAELRFPLPSASGDEAPARQWLKLRAFALQLWNGVDGPFRGPLLRAQAAAYGLKDLDPWTRRRAGAEEEAGPSLLALLGGRAAVDETLQLDRPLNPAPGEKAPRMPLAELTGLSIPPHPWADLRAGAPRTASLPLALCVPQDRAFLFLPKPKDALGSLEGRGAAFLQRVSSFTGNGGTETQVVARLLEDLGLGGGRGRQLIESGAIREAVAFFPDLAFLAGTEATVVADLARPGEAPFLPQGGPHGFKTPAGQAFAARRGDRIFLSTSRTELDRALSLDAAKGAGSLGASDEFAVILGKLAPTPSTEFFFYLPDPFIRHLLGPRQRILQARQNAARAHMEGVAAAALLRRLDVPGAPLSLGDLKARGYLPPEVDLAGITLLPDGRVHHATFGPLERPRPLERIPLEAVDPGEAEAYEAFKESYGRYWSRWFDPIALRMDAGPGGRMALETFVLPLVENTLYQPVREFLAQEGPLPRPRWRQAPVAEFTVRLVNDGRLQGHQEPKGLRHLLGDFPWLKDGLLKHGTGVVSVAFPDGAPVIASGNGSPATLLQADPLGSRNGLVGLGAVALGIFTRPMALAFELKDPEATRKVLQEECFRFLAPGLSRSREFQFLPSTEPGGGVRIRWDLFGVASMTFIARVEDRWLVFTNDASQPPSLVEGTQEGDPFAARLALTPQALRLGLPAAFQAASEGEARSAFASIAWLAPWLISTRDVGKAQAESRRILGQAPSLEPFALDPDRWWEHRRFGSPQRPRTPALDPGQDFGLFEGVRDPQVEMRMEEDGMRARVTWSSALPALTMMK